MGPFAWMRCPDIDRLVVPVAFPRILLLTAAFSALAATPGRAAAIEFNLPAQSAAESLLAFSRQAQVEVLYSYDALRPVTTDAVIGSYEPEDALNRLLKSTGFMARRKQPGKFVVTRSA